MKLFIVLILTFIFSSYKIPDLIEKPAPYPFLELPDKEYEPDKIDNLENQEDKTANKYYELGLYYLLDRNFDQSIKNLKIALEKNPNFLSAYIQLGFIYVWNKEPRLALKYFMEGLEKFPCDKKILYGLEQTCHMLTRKEALSIYLKILDCNPKSTDILFQVGLCYYQLNDLEKAKSYFLQVLDLDPSIIDAKVQLAYIYHRQKDFSSLEKLYLSNTENREISLLYAQELVRNQHFKKAVELYERYPEKNPNYRNLEDLRLHTNYILTAENNYTYAKEWDPTLDKAVVKDYYLLDSLKINIPINDPFRVELTNFFYRQKEDQLTLPYGLNYDVYEFGLQLLGHYYFSPDWSLDMMARALDAYGNQGTAQYPFQSTVRLEPGISLKFSSDQFFYVDTHIESFIIKNFSESVSQLMQTDFLQGMYGIHPDIYMHPVVDFYSGLVFYHDGLDNKKYMQSIKTKIDLGTPYLSLSYWIEHSSFDYLNQNYYSYKDQVRNSFEIRYQQDFLTKLQLALFWKHTAEMTHNLYLPIGDTVYVADRLYLIWNTYTAQFSYRFKDKWKLDFSSHYLYNTLPYWDWNIRMNFSYRF